MNFLNKIEKFSPNVCFIDENAALKSEMNNLSPLVVSKPSNAYVYHQIFQIFKI